MMGKVDQEKSLKILFVAAEAAPFATIGGLSQVMHFLPRTLKKRGHDVRVFLPKFGLIDEEKFKIKMLYHGLRVPTGEKEGRKELICNVKIKEGNKEEPTVYFLENMEYYEKRANIYGYSDDTVRFALLCRGVLEFIDHYGEWQPEVIHCNDWHTALLPNFLKTLYAQKTKLKEIATVFSIHNLRFQGGFDPHFVSDMNFDDGRSPIASFFSDRLLKQNFMRRGIIYADILNTVSETYSREILTAEYGEGLDQLLKEVRTKLFGVLNGLDYEHFNPSTDKVITKNYNLNDLKSREENRVALQKEFNLPVCQDPILAICGRLDEQKGLDLLVKILPLLLAEYPLQLLVMGVGEAKYHLFFRDLEKKFPKKVVTHLMADWVMPRKIYAGSDVFLLPSRFEPGGIAAMEAMRYGAVPVVRSTGGLADIISDFDPQKNIGNGFSFQNYSEWALFAAIIRALENYKNPKLWQEIVKRAMREDFSWEKSARKYEDLYRRALTLHRLNLAGETVAVHQEMT